MLIQECWGVVGAGALVYAPTPTFCCDKKAKKNLTTKNKMRQKIHIEVKYYTRGVGVRRVKEGGGVWKGQKRFNNVFEQPLIPQREHKVKNKLTLIYALRLGKHWILKLFFKMMFSLTLEIVLLSKKQRRFSTPVVMHI